MADIMRVLLLWMYFQLMELKFF